MEDRVASVAKGNRVYDPNPRTPHAGRGHLNYCPLLLTGNGQAVPFFEIQPRIRSDDGNQTAEAGKNSDGRVEKKNRVKRPGGGRETRGISISSM